MSTLSLRGEAMQRAAARLGLPPPRALDREADRATELLTELRRVAPVAFRDPPPALAIGIRKTIEQRMRADYSPRDVATALRRWCRRSDYLRAIVAGAERVDLDGQCVGLVTDSEAEHAREQLQGIAARAGPAKHVR